MKRSPQWIFLVFGGALFGAVIGSGRLPKEELVPLLTCAAALFAMSRSQHWISRVGPSIRWAKPLLVAAVMLCLGFGMRLLVSGNTTTAECEGFLFVVFGLDALVAFMAVCNAQMEDQANHIAPSTR